MVVRRVLGSVEPKAFEGNVVLHQKYKQDRLQFVIIFVFEALVKVVLLAKAKSDLNIIVATEEALHREEAKIIFIEPISDATDVRLPALKALLAHFHAFE